MGRYFARVCFAVLLAASWAVAETPNFPYQPLPLAPPPLPPCGQPFPNLPPMVLDEEHDGIGVAQQMARERGAQGRVLWIDGLANIARLNSPALIASLAKQIKAAGFNTVVLDVKPIPGFTLYPSKYAPKMTEWHDEKLPEDVDPLGELVKDGHAEGLSVVANFNVFCEGHRWAGKGPGFEHPEWQSTLLEPIPVLVGIGGRMPLSGKPATALPSDSVAVTTSFADVPLSPTAVVVVTDEARKVVAMAFGTEAREKNLPVPPGGAVLAAIGAAGDFLRASALLGDTLTIEADPHYVPSSQSSTHSVALWTNPNDPRVQQRILNMVSEVVTKYSVDGVIFDDRLRYAGVQADFSEESRKEFDAFIGHPLNWPCDVLRPEVSFPSLSRRLLPGPYFAQWQLWHALTIRNWLARAVNTVKEIRPTTTVSTYVGSWYGDYFNIGSNWGADDLQAGFRALTDDYRRTGYAGMLDWIATGCYYPTAGIADADTLGVSPGDTIEAAGQLSNRCVNNKTWVYAGIELDQFYGNPEGLERALQAAAASTQGVMVFDLSHHIDQFWPVFQKAFSKPAAAPHAIPGLREQVDAEVARRHAAGIIDPPVIINNGMPGTGL